MTGEIIIETICGEDDLGIIIPFVMATLISIGGAVMGEMVVEGDILVAMVVVTEDTVVSVEGTVVLMVETEDN